MIRAAFFAFLLLPAFCSGQTYFLTGDATFLGGDCYQLTPEIGNSVGTVWYGEQIDLDSIFDLQFLMNFGVLDATGADGICFVLQTVGTEATGVTGGGLGYMDFGTSLGIEFDTWQNAEYGDPEYDHIAIEMNGEINHLTDLGNLSDFVQANIDNANVEDGEDHIVRIKWNPENTTLEVYFDCEFRIAAEVDLKNTIFSGNNLVYWGFTAATGGSVNLQTVCLQENVVTLEQEVNICEGESATLTSWDSSDGTYVWTPATYLDDATIQSPIATPPATMNYSVTFLDACGVETQLSYEVIVAESYSADAGEDVVITCDDDVQTLNAESDGGDALFSWSLDGDPIAGAHSALYNAAQAGTYTVTVSNPSGGCGSSDDVVVATDLSAPVIIIGEQDSLSCANPSVMLQDITITSVHDYDFLWLGVDAASPGNLTPVVTEPGEYVLTATDVETGCTTQAFTYVDVEGNYQADFSSLVFPNILTANDDAKNSEWKPFLGANPGFNLSGAFKTYTVSIYNRWGNLVFETANYSSAWRGKESAPGVYFYVVQYETYCQSTLPGTATGSIELVK